MTRDPEVAARVAAGLRDYGTAFAALAGVFADRLHLPTRDASALVHVIEAEEAGAPLSAARLADRVGLTPAATSALLNRMEAAGHVLRQRGDADRRVVTLLSTPAVHGEVDAFFDPLGARLDALMAEQSPEFLHRLDDFLQDVVAALRTHGRDPR